MFSKSHSGGGNGDDNGGGDLRGCGNSSNGSKCWMLFSPSHAVITPVYDRTFFTHDPAINPSLFNTLECDLCYIKSLFSADQRAA